MKKILFVILLIFIVLGPISTVFAEGKSDIITSVGITQNTSLGTPSLFTGTNNNSITSEISTPATDFNYTSNGTSVTIIKYIGSSAEVIIPSEINGTPVTKIRDFAFYYCPNLTNVTIPATVTTIGDSAFEICINLTSINIPSSVTTIGDLAFSRCVSLASIEVDESNLNYSSENGVLFNKDKTSLIQYPGKKGGEYNVPASVMNIADSAFYGCNGLLSINVSDDNPNYSSDNGVLYNKTKTTLIQFPREKTGEYNIPDSVTGIGKYALTICMGLSSVTIPNSITGIDYHAFSTCPSLTSINVEGNNEYYSSVDGVLFNKAKTTLIKCPERRNGHYTIPMGVTSINNIAFLACNSLTGVDIPNGVTDIGSNAFAVCTGLTDITFPNSVTNIADGAFNACTGLTSITIPSSVTSIGWDAFSDCTELSSLYFEGDAPTTFGNLDNAAPGFKIYYLPTAQGFTTDKWEDYPTATYSIITGITLDTPTNLTQTYGSTSAVTFTATTVPDGIINSSKIEWYVNDVKQDITGTAFTCTPTNAGDYIISVRASDNPTATVDFKTITVTKSDPTVTWPILDPVTYTPTLTLSDISLDAGFTWEDPTTVLNAPGGNYSVLYTPNDIINYNTIAYEVSLTVIRAQQSAPNIKVSKTTNTITIAKVEGAEYCLTLKSSPGPIVYSDNNKFTSLKDDTKYTAYIRMKETNNYKASPPATLDVRTDKNSSKGDHSGTITVTPPISNPAETPAPKPYPTDIDQVDWAKDAVLDVINQGIMSGYPEEGGTTAFKPLGTTTRAEFATSLFNYLKFTYDGGKIFNDTKDHWAKEYISKMAKEGIMLGYNDTNFAPDDPITREQIATILNRTFKPTTSPTDFKYQDDASISDWARDSVYTVYSAGWIKGDDLNNFNPLSNATRAELAVIFSRLANDNIKIAQ